MAAVRLFGGRDARISADYSPFEQGIGGEAVGAMQAGCGGFADYEQARHGRTTDFVRDRPADEVVGPRAHRNRVLGEVEIERRTDAGDRWKQHVRVALHTTEVQVDVRVVGGHHAVEDRAAHDVARREVRHRVHAGHEAVAVAIAQHRTSAAHDFADEEA